MSENPTEQNTEKKGKSIFKRPWFWVIVIIVIIIFASSSNGNKGDQTAQTNSGQTTSQSSSQPASTPKQDGSIKAGMYKVGKDLPAGEYVIVASGSGYFQVSSDSTGKLESIISNDMFENRSIITVKDGEYFEFKTSKAYPIDKAPKVEPKNGVLQSGMYKVGPDLAAGEYKVSATGDGYIEVADNSRHTLTGISSNDIFTGDKYVTVQSGQYIKLQSAELALK